jgi:hypothetical protein
MQLIINLALIWLVFAALLLVIVLQGLGRNR